MMRWEQTISSGMIGKYLALSSLFCVNFVVFCVSVIFGYKLIPIMGFVFSVTIFIFPLSYACQDIITEVYGFRVARILIWVSFSGLLLFASLIMILLHLPFLATWHHQPAYSETLGGIFRLTLAIIVSLITGDFLNAYVLSKWKILLKGKNFWIRSFGSTAVGEAVDTLMGFSVAFAGLVSPEKFFWLVASTYFAKLIWSAVLVLPSSVIVSFLKNALKLDIFDYGVDFNPFRFQLRDKPDERESMHSSAARF